MLSINIWIVFIIYLYPWTLTNLNFANDGNFHLLLETINILKYLTLIIKDNFILKEREKERERKGKSEGVREWERDRERGRDTERER